MLFRRPTWTVLMSCRRVRKHYEQISPFERGRAIGLKKAGEGQISVSLDGWVEAMLSFDDATIRRCWYEWVTHGLTERQKGSDRPRATPEREDRVIARSAVPACAINGLAYYWDASDCNDL